MEEKPKGAGRTSAEGLEGVGGGWEGQSCVIALRQEWAWQQGTQRPKEEQRLAGPTRKRGTVQDVGSSGLGGRHWVEGPDPEG